jgi:WD40 repeat protein
MNATGAADTVAQSVTGGLIGHPLWSADSVYIAYTISPAPVSDVQGLAVYNVTTAVVTPIAAPADTNAPTAIVGQLAWLPNHTPAALTWAARAGGEVTGVFRASVASSASVTRLTPIGATYTTADVSSSGVWLLARGSTLATIATDQTSPQVAMTLGHTATLVDWAPSGQVAAVLSGDALSLLTPDGGLVTIAHGLTAQSLVVWSPESAALAWQSGNTVVSAQIHQGAASGAKSVAQNADVLALVWAPDGQSLAVRSSAGLLLVTADGAHIRATDGQATSGGQLSWSLAG